MRPARGSIAARLAAWTAPIQRVTARVEKIFGTWKRCCDQRRMLWRGIARARTQVHLTATAYDLK
jgi:IS5 family transposase